MMVFLAKVAVFALRSKSKRSSASTEERFTVDSMVTWGFLMVIFPLKMVIFQFAMLVYQRANHI
jgi:hypothetical protein